jgi:hypothetical protein
MPLYLPRAGCPAQESEAVGGHGLGLLAAAQRQYRRNQPIPRLAISSSVFVTSTTNKYGVMRRGGVSPLRLRRPYEGSFPSTSVERTVPLALRGVVLQQKRQKDRPYHPRFLRCVRLTWHAVTGAPHRLLLSHFSNWNQVKGREVDVQLLEGLLDLRATYDDLEPTLWPTGSVQACC